MDLISRLEVTEEQVSEFEDKSLEMILLEIIQADRKNIKEK